ncbi:uncharacterized protein CANTADRAFT_302114 [Suhomyces tanzawaensis NRRL Y-17324]|uniref:Uncharacterized protein n=1 Tax=Suhomyces tanzawaensis NRRL Y-17324 TaxID=984487 RepID=A0A1E4SCG9_9ASCO|nr:uncharacterized protein CANTADRAFT_302114 [Suhomyces tanzawaensis NRRL Y-17324]ODV77217.1 hypothetical protein CANTADRAFT_302114 [Suhomyces tanzawaensis NRRL Y-17324]
MMLPSVIGHTTDPSHCVRRRLARVLTGLAAPREVVSLRCQLGEKPGTAMISVPLVPREPLSMATPDPVILMPDGPCEIQGLISGLVHISWWCEHGLRPARGRWPCQRYHHHPEPAAAAPHTMAAGGQGGRLGCTLARFSPCRVWC